MNTPLRRAILSASLALVTSLPAWARPSLSNFDGRWSVIIITDAGSCDRTARYGVQIAGGRVLGGTSGVAMSGRVDSGGRVVVSLRSGQASASGSGRLSGSNGFGRWQGVSGSSRCAGRWQAERTG